ncbi:Hypothetical predicted protein [Pelobates cultripes]|uniref:Uncharacterized protein n=1 Tax=Pelobates cultripes TaxID=61616 RepID=A0AAD1W3K0_PELCU|nr:Hypothetical predicted protein [Pelobates cultripes]
MTNTLSDYFTTNSTPDIQPTPVWQAHKAVMRGHMISQASCLNKKSKEEHRTLLRTLRDTTKANTVQPTPQRMQTITDTTARLNNLELAKTAHILQKLKQTTYMQGNKAGKYLATQLRQKQSNAKIPYLLTQGGEKIHNPQDINDNMDNMATY